VSVWGAPGPARTVALVTMTLLMCLVMALVVCYVVYTLEQATLPSGLYSRY
jgi:hypothetical protein